MCGIVGVFGSLPAEAKFNTARDLMTHRGPDDAGTYYNQAEEITLGQRRLSIIDLSSAGHQPFVSNDGRYVAVFNGEIYNYQEIRQELSSFYNFKTKTDTEVLLAAFIKWGPECLQKFNGMFAVAIWDRENRDLFLVRDRLGIKPLYYYHDQKTFCFASEIKAILECVNLERKLNRQALLDYLSYRYSLGESTMFENILSVLPGHYLVIDKSGIKTVKYWDLPVVENKVDLGEEEILKHTEALLEQSLRYRMISDVPLGAYLSGGLDSSLLVAMMGKLTGKQVKTFSITFAESGFDESLFAKQVAKHCQAEHHEIKLDVDSYLNLLPEVIGHKDLPLGIPNEVAIHVLSKELKKHISVVLSGEGADELFGGYGKIFRSGYDFERMVNNSGFSDLEKEQLKVNLKKKYGDSEFKNIADHFLSQYTYFPFNEKRDLLNPELFSGGKYSLDNKKYFSSFFEKINRLSPSEQYLYIFQKIHLLGPLFRLDTSTMSRAVEARVPFVDYELVEYVSSLPLKYKMAWKSADAERESRVLNSDQISEEKDVTKYLLRKIATKYLPEEIINRKKLGFPVPLNDWFGGGKYADFAKELLLSPKAKTNSLFRQDVLALWLDNHNNSQNNRRGYNIWMLVNLEIWLNQYNVSI